MTLHCETTALGVLLAHAGLDLSEPMRFGLGAGLSFVYWDSKRQPFPFLGGRTKPFQLTRDLADRLDLELHVRETTSARKAWEQVREPLDRGEPVGLQLDSAELDYFTSRVSFPGHVVAMVGYDDERAYLVDTAQQGGPVTTSLASLARARAVRGPMSAKHRSFTIRVPDDRATAPDRFASTIVDAMTSCAAAFLDPPIANLGHRGIRTTARRLPTWFDRVDDPARDLPVIASLMERAGTGGALFRNLYRDFLTETAPVLREAGRDRDAGVVDDARARYADAAIGWTAVATLIDEAGRTAEPARLDEAAARLEDIAAIEVAAMSSLRSLGAADRSD